MTEQATGRCIDCRHWDKDGREAAFIGYPSGMRACLLPSDDGWDQTTGPAFFADSLDGVFGLLVTAANFGCVCWKP